MPGVFSEFDSRIRMYNIKAQEGTDALLAALQQSDTTTYTLFFQQYLVFASAEAAVRKINDAMGVTERGFTA